MKHHSRKLALLVGLATMLLAPAAFAQGGPGGGPGDGPGFRGHRGRGGFGPRIAQELELTAEQRQQMQALRAEHQEAMAPLRQDMQELHQQMRQAWAAESPNRTTILSLGQRIDALRAAERDLREEHRAEARQILTAEQQARLDELRSERGRRGSRGMRGRRGPGSGPGMGRGHGPGMGRGHGPGMGRGHGPGMGRGPGPGMGRGFGPRMAEQLNLDESQRVRIRALRQEMRQDLEPNRTQMRALREQMRALRQAENANPGAISAVRTQLDAQRSQVRERQVDFRIDVLEILTAEQRAQLNELRENAPGPGHRGRRGFGRRGPRVAE